MSTRPKSTRNREAIDGWIFVLPFILGYTIFAIAPAIGTFGLAFLDVNSFARANDLGSASFSGFTNFINAFQNPTFAQSLGRTLSFTTVYAPVLVVLSLVIAVVLNQVFYFKRLSMTLIFLPYVTNVAAIGLVMNLFFQPTSGPVNTLLAGLGISDPPLWLLDPNLALPLAAIISAWQGIAFQTVIFLVALRNVNKDLYEASRIDGAGPLRRFFSVTLPVISPTTFLVAVTAVIQSFASYSLLANLTGGGPGQASTTLIYNIIDTTFTFNQYSFASAQALVQFVVILAITIIQWRAQKRWVHY